MDNSPSWADALPPFRRMMIFIDGENLVLRYQNLVKNGKIPRDGIEHVEDVLVWDESFTHLVGMHVVIRATYYTYACGDENKIAEITNKIKGLKYQSHPKSLLPKTLTPKVFWKKRRHQKAKGVDIQMTVDILSHVYNDNVDSIMLLSGDGDYIPVITEVQRCGKLCYVAAFSDGLNEDIKNICDEFYCLDHTAFK